MNKRTLVFVFLAVPLALFADSFRFTESGLHSLISECSIPASLLKKDSSVYSVHSLLEVLPLMEDVYRMEIVASDNSVLLDDDGLGELWGESYLADRDGSVDLLFNGRWYRGIKSIAFSGTPMESKSLSIWLNWEGVEELKNEITLFAGLHGISVNTQKVPKPESKLVTVVKARGKVPDIVLVKSSSVEKLEAAGAIQRTGYIKMPDLMPTGVEAFTLNGAQWGVPFYFDTQIIFYNKKLLTPEPAEGWTLKDMERDAQRLLEKGVHPMVWNAYGSNWLIPFQVSFGKDRLINGDGSITVDDKPTADALEYIMDLKNKGLLVPMERDAMDALFIKGKVGMIISGSYAIPYFKSLGIDFGIMPFPVNGSTGRPLSPLLDYKGFVITRKTHSPVLARRLLQYLEGSGVQQRFCSSLTKLPARTGVLDLPGFSRGDLRILEKQVGAGTVIPPDHVYSIYKNNMWKLLRFALSGRMTVDQTLKQGQILMDNSY